MILQRPGDLKIHVGLSLDPSRSQLPSTGIVNEEILRLGAVRNLGHKLPEVHIHVLLHVRRVQFKYSERAVWMIAWSLRDMVERFEARWKQTTPAILD